MDKNNQLRNVIAQGWTLMFIVFLANITIEIVKSMLNIDASKWSEHLSAGSVQLILVLMAIYAVVPMLIHTISKRWFRYVSLALAVVITLLHVGIHHMAHGTADPEKASQAISFPHVLHLSHHILGIWVIIVSIMWIRRSD